MLEISPQRESDDSASQAPAGVREANDSSSLPVDPDVVSLVPVQRHADSLEPDRRMDEVRGYPKDLAARIRASWPADALPLPRRLEALLDIAYHASFLRDEERPVRCRLLVLPPSQLAVDTGPPNGLLPLVFDESRSYDEHELRRLSPAAEPERAFIGVVEEGNSFKVWGIVQSGPRWLQVAQGGRAVEPPVPPTLVVRILRPGHLLVGCDGRLVAELRGGRLSNMALDVFQAKWMPERFRAGRAQMAAEHMATAAPHLDEASAGDLTGYLAQQMVKRIVSTVRAAHHGGTIVIGPPSCLVDRVLFAKYSFDDTTARRRFRSLVLSTLSAVARQVARKGVDRVEASHAHGASSSRPTRSIGRESYLVTHDEQVEDLDEGLFELGHLIASLASVDGAVVLTNRFEILGFGAEIAGALPTVTEVRRGLDLEADEYVMERVDGVGTRHRSAYRLCAASPETMVIVVSQDRGARFIAHHRGAVTYWDHGLGGD